MSWNRSFDPKDLERLSKNIVNRIVSALDNGDLIIARKLCCELDEERIPLRNFYLYLLTPLLTFIGNNFGNNVLYNALLSYGKKYMAPLIEKLETMEVKEKIENTARVWRAQCSHFKFHEEKDKFVLTLYCESGGRLIREGAYEHPFSFLRVRVASSMTWGKRDMPVYCCH